MDRIRTRLVVGTAAGLATAMFLMILYWILTSSLEDLATVAAAGVVGLLLFGLAWLARRGRLRLSAWLLTALLLLLVFGSSAEYGLGSPGMAALVLPILVAALALGQRAGYAVTGLAVLLVWGLGLAAASGGWEAAIPYQVADLTFNAPFFSLLFGLTAALAGEFSRQVERQLPEA